MVEKPSESVRKTEQEKQMERQVLSALKHDKDLAKTAVWKWEGATQRNRAERGESDRSLSSVHSFVSLCRNRMIVTA